MSAVVSLAVSLNNGSSELHSQWTRPLPVASTGYELRPSVKHVSFLVRVRRVVLQRYMSLAYDLRREDT